MPGRLRERKDFRRNRRRALERDCYRCRICFVAEAQEVDHLVRQYDGGSDELDNLISVCSACHASRTAEQPAVGK